MLKLLSGVIVIKCFYCNKKKSSRRLGALFMKNGGKYLNKPKINKTKNYCFFKLILTKKKFTLSLSFPVNISCYFMTFILNWNRGKEENYSQVTFYPPCCFKSYQKKIDKLIIH